MSIFKKLPEDAKKRLAKILTTFLWIYFAAFGIVAMHFVRRIFIAERFKIPTMSMSPTLNPGDHIWVNKLLFGARIYTDFNFEDHAPLKCFRMPGIREIKPNDIVVFNYPFGYDDWYRIEFKINYVYCKRVAGTPGDSIAIEYGITYNNNCKEYIGLLENQIQLSNIPDSVFWYYNSMTAIPLSRPTWTIKNLGPLYVPAKGGTVELDDFNRELYGLAIQYETGQLPTEDMKQYTFKNNYYFMLGDNSCDSQDSRYFGFVPEDFIIGIVGGKKGKQ